MAFNTKGLKKKRLRAISRRQFIKTTLAGAAAAGAGSLIFPYYGSAIPKQIVHVNWGGDALHCYKDIDAKSFTDKTGVTVAIDGTGPKEGKIKAMIESKNITWDVLDVDLWVPIRLGPLGMLEPIDYSIVDKNKVMPHLATEYAVGSYLYASVLTYDASKCGNDPPKSWADMWNVKKYPGKRCLYKWMNGAVEATLLADGVPPDKVYPLDVDRALRKIAEIKDDIFFWGSNAEAQQMFRQGEVVMGQMYSSRASVLERDTNGRIRWTWNQGIGIGAGWAVPKGNPAGREWAMKWIAWMQDARRQVEILKCLGVGPTNPAAADLMDPDLRRINPGSPENWNRMIPHGAKYYGEHYAKDLSAWVDGISS